MESFQIIVTAALVALVIGVGIIIYVLENIWRKIA